MKTMASLVSITWLNAFLKKTSIKANSVNLGMVKYVETLRKAAVLWKKDKKQQQKIHNLKTYYNTRSVSIVCLKENVL